MIIACCQEILIFTESSIMTRKGSNKLIENKRQIQPELSSTFSDDEGMLVRQLGVIRVHLLRLNWINPKKSVIEIRDIILSHPYNNYAFPTYNRLLFLPKPCFHQDNKTTFLFGDMEFNKLPENYYGNNFQIQWRTGT